MDLLQDILQQAGLRRRILHQHALHQPWGLRFPCPHSMGFHVVLQGEAWLWQGEPHDGNPPLQLQQGDLIFMARGQHHQLSTHPDAALLVPADGPPVALPADQPGSTAPLLTLASGVYQLWNDPIHPLFAELPVWSRVRGSSLPAGHALGQSLQLLSQELQSPRLGSSSVVESLLDVLFYLILRHLLSQPEQQASWSRGVADPLIAQSLQLMHADPGRAWRVQDLADASGLSRSGFALRFKQTLGQSPLRYLTTLRMQQAMQALSQPDAPGLEVLARSASYQDAFAFSKAFKKLLGVSPRTFQRQSQQALARRF
ncbi:MAG: AraC family transcriptional regulator [Candidatus Sericytochromatia bacterium]|nr:AraC family transcriptional regulator [Candidatus Sericytochromatia bacterium]